MARFDVLRNPNPATATAVPYVVVLQHPLFDDLATRLVAPLYAGSAVRRRLTRLNPAFAVEGREVVLMVTETVGIPVSALGPVVASLGAEAPVILGALDFLLSG